MRVTEDGLHVDHKRTVIFLQFSPLIEAPVALSIIIL